MAKFTYIGGLTKTDHFSEAFGSEVNGVKMPASTTAFGIEFIVNQPVDVTLDSFKGRGIADPARALRHALAKLATNQYFKPFAEDVPVEMVEPEKVRGKPGPKPKTPEAPAE